jgi:hypothetical protein
MRLKCLSLLALVGASAASAETLRVETWRPAGSDQVSALRTIQIDSFGGASGPGLAIAIEDRLRRIELGQGPWFRIIPASIAQGDGEAVLRGTADLGMRASDYTAERERCIKDAQGKCTDRKEKYLVNCRRRDFQLELAVRMIARDGTLLWSDDQPEYLQDSNCSDDSSGPPTRSAIERQLIGRIAARVEAEFAPRREFEEVRVDENRKGLAKPDAASFKAAVRSVKDGQGQTACAAWATLGQAYPQHQPTQFNLGLCAEAAGDDARARTQYDLVARLNPRQLQAASGLRRLDARARAFRQVEAHLRD